MLFGPENRIVQLCVVLLFASCQSPAGKTPTPTPDTTSKSRDTAPLKTHLKDTTFIAGNALLFLQPDDARYKELNDNPDNEAGEADSDFGVGISNTQDSVAKNARYKTIKVQVSTRRYISIKDCINCPLVIDRDSINYGYILSGKGKKIDSSYNSVHSGHYLGEIDNYFFSGK